MCMSLGALVWVFGCSTFGYTHDEPQTLSCGYLNASLGVRLQLYRTVFFMCSSVSAQGYLGHPELVYLSCFMSEPGILPPCIPQTWYQSGKDCNLLVQIGAHGINHDFGEPTHPFSIPMVSHTHTHILLRWLPREISDIQLASLTHLTI